LRGGRAFRNLADLASKAIRQVEEAVFGLVRGRMGKNEDESSRGP